MTGAAAENVIGCLTTVSRVVLFIPVCLLLFLLGVGKGVIVGPAAFVIMVVGHTAVTFGLWPLHVVMTYYTVAKAKKLGTSAKFLSFLCLPVPLVLWPLTVLVGSILVGLGYGFVTPMVATFEAAGSENDSKMKHCFVDGTWSIIEGSCTVVRDFTDLSYHSFMDYLTDFREKSPKHGKPYRIQFLKIPSCILVAVLGVLLDVPVIIGIAVVKAPIMLFKGWQRLLKDLWGRQGPFLELVCVPFAGLAIVVWPAVVVGGVFLTAVVSPVLGLYGAVVVYQERSFKRGLAYIVNVIAQFDEYSNDVLHLNEGSIFPRPKYRDNDDSVTGDSAKYSSAPPRAVPKSGDQEPTAQGVKAAESKEPKEGPMDAGDSSSTSPSRMAKSPSQAAPSYMMPSKSLRKTFQDVKLVQVWDNLFQYMDILGKHLVEEDVIKAPDLEGWLNASKKEQSKILSVGLPACGTLNTVLRAAKARVTGMLLYDGTEITMQNRPKDRLSDWLFEPLVVLKDQVIDAKLTYAEEQYMQKWVFTLGDTVLMDKWQNGGVEPANNMRRGELQALCRRLQGISTSYSRLPTYKRRFQNFINSLHMFAQSHSLPPRPPPKDEISRADEPQGDDVV